MDEVNRYKYLLITVLVILFAAGGIFLASSTRENNATAAPTPVVMESNPVSSGQVKFSDTTDATFAVQIFPGATSDQAKQAMAGYEMQTKDVGNGTTQITLIPNGQTDRALVYQVKSDQKLYFVETRMGDDQSAGTDSNLEDDYGVIVDSQGFVVSQ